MEYQDTTEMAKNALPHIPKDTLDHLMANMSYLGCNSRLPQLCCDCDLEAMHRRLFGTALEYTLRTLIYICVTAVGNTAEYQHIQMLSKIILSPKYEPKIRPRFPASPAVVTLAFNILSIDDLDIKDMGFTIDLFLNQEWYDDRLKHSHCTYLDAGLFASQIWTPDTYFVESKRAKFHTVTDKNIMIKVFPDGKVYYSARLSVRVSCAMDLRKFPMDIQKCPLSIESYGYGANEIIYQWQNKSSYIYTVQSHSISQYDLKPIILLEERTQYVIGEWSTLKIIFVFDRKSSIFIPAMYFPCAVIVVISWITFFLDPDHFPARTSLCVTAVLTIVTIEAGINSSLPKVSYVKMIDLYVLVCVIFVSGVFLEYAMILLIKEKKRKFYRKQVEKLEQSSGNLKAITPWLIKRKYHTDFQSQFCYATGECSKLFEPEDLIVDPGEGIHKEHLKQLKQIEKTTRFYLRDKWPRVLDYYSRIFFPLSFIAFNAIYWLGLH